MKPILTAIAILAVTVVHIISGSALISIGRSHASLFKEADCKLPLISELSTNYTATTAPIIVGLLLGMMTVLGLGLVFRPQTFHWLLPFLLSLSFVTVILHIMFVVFGITVPLLPVTPTMSQQ